MTPVVDRVLSAERKEAYGAALDLLATKIAEDEHVIGLGFPYVTAPDGSWRTMRASRSAGYTGGAWSHGNWFCGFWVGLHLAAYLWTLNERHLGWAKERMLLVAPRADDPNTHDIGFIFWGSAIPLFHVTGDPRYAGMALRAADRLRARLITTRGGAYISSWGPLSDQRGRRSSAIDTMANLPLLYWAADRADDGSFRLAGEAHAKMTRAAFVRADFSTYHAVEYDLATGARARGFTFQGAFDESCWPRGQAWAIYGFAATARATGKPEHLELAERLADYYLARLNDGLVPYWDFDDPAIPDAPRDSSASAIAAAALLDIGAQHPDAGTAGRRAEQACSLLDALCRDYLAHEPGHRGLLKCGCYSKSHGEGVASAVLFGDFYFVEALMKLLLPGRFQPPACRSDEQPAREAL
jgi:unsaturated chondroitin disaccharide hydrolase